LCVRLCVCLCVCVSEGGDGRGKVPHKRVPIVLHALLLCLRYLPRGWYWGGTVHGTYGGANYE